MIDNTLTRWLFAKIYRKWLVRSYYKSPAKVIKVKGWRTALVEWGGGCERSTITPIFWWFK